MEISLAYKIIMISLDVIGLTAVGIMVYQQLKNNGKYVCKPCLNRTACEVPCKLYLTAVQDRRK